jgi:hypothetical protein
MRSNPNPYARRVQLDDGRTGSVLSTHHEYTIVLLDSPCAGGETAPKVRTSSLKFL